jgi:hypothetical protein
MAENIVQRKRPNYKYIPPHNEPTVYRAHLDATPVVEEEETIKVEEQEDKEPFKWTSLLTDTVRIRFPAWLPIFSIVVFKMFY